MTGPRSTLAGQRVLLVTFGSVLRPDGGMAVRARATVDALQRLGAEVRVISHHEPAGAPHVTALRRPLRLGFSTELVRSVRVATPATNLVIVESALLLPAVLAARPKAPIVWDTNECETLHYQRLTPTPANRARLLVWRALENWASGRVACAVAISEREAGAWKSLFPRLAGKTVTVAHQALAHSAEPWRPPSAAPDTTVLLFVGNSVGKHNAAAADWLTRILAPTLPPSTLLVLAGRGTEAYAGDGVLGLGLVEDIDAVIAGADVCLAPLQVGAGVKTKVLHYLAHGRPVIATPAAMEGIEDAPGVTEVDLDDFPAAVAAAPGQPAPDAQRAWVAAHHGPAVVASQWRDALQPLLADRPPAVSALRKGMRAELRNWLRVGVAAWVVMPSRCPPRVGMLGRFGQRLVTVRLRSGETLRCHLAEMYAVAEVFALAAYDRPGVAWSRARTIVDVGANIGAATVWMARRAPAARIVAIEPSPAAVSLLRHNVTANSLDHRVTVVDCALAGVAGSVQLARSSTSVSGRVVSGSSPGGGIDVVACRTLSSVLADTGAGCGQIDVLKLDCEGAEFDILETMAPAELAQIGAIVGEYHTFGGRHPEELAELLASAGFSYSWSGGEEIGTFCAVRP